jgi:hypothetical protein
VTRGARGSDAHRPRDPFDGFACRVGDVIVRAGGDEAWLASALVLSEDAPVCAIFVAPEAGGDRAVFVRRGDATLVWLEAIDPAVILTGAEPPSVIEHGTTRFDRTRRLPLRVARVGDAPDIGERAVLAEYAAPSGERLVVCIGASARLAWSGVALETGMYDRLPGGDP